MEKRYQVFVSSTYQDLVEERQEVMQALLELDCIPAGMELFPAANEDQWTLIRGVIDDCDYYLVVIGGRYGSVGPDGVSYTEMEYRYALDKGKPVVAFLHSDPEQLPAKKTERDPPAREKLAAFRSLCERKMCKHWSSPADLGSVVSRSIIKLTKTTPAIGWVRADEMPEHASAEETLRLRKQIEELQAELAATRVGPPPGTEALAQGDDTLEIHYTCGVFKPGSFRADETAEGTIVPSWNELFYKLSPILIAEASEKQLASELIQLAEQQGRAEQKKRKTLKGYSLREFKLDPDGFYTVLVQFLALRLIARSVKQRSVKDRQNYYTLTPYGESLMMSLRAIRRVTPAG